MASIERRPLKNGDVSFRVIWNQAGRRQSETFGDQRSAQRFQIDVEEAGGAWPADWIRGVGYRQTLVPEAELIPAAEPRRVVPTLLEAAIAHTESKNTKAQPEHRMKMRRQFEQHLGDLGDLPLDAVTRGDVQDWVDAFVEDGKAYKTIKNLRSDVSTVYKFAVLEGLATVNPVLGTHIDAEPGDARPPVFLTHEEYAAVAGFLSGEDLVYVETLVRTGLRKGEALALSVLDVHLDTDYPSIGVNKARKHAHDGNHRIGATKTRAGMRTVVIDEELADLLRRHIGNRTLYEPLFPEHGNDGSWQRNHWVPAIKAAMLAEPRRPRVHDLRHTHASWLLADRVPLFEVSKRLGHSDIQTTANIYGHLDTHAMSSDAIGKAMRGRRRAELHAV
jgi:integrase